MNAFEYHNPTRIVFGAGQISRLAQLVPQEARVLLLYGGGSAHKTGTLYEVKAALGSRFVVEFGGIEPNPEYDTLLRAVAEVKQQQIDFLLAVGGGSVIDGTKFVAAAACFDGDPWAILQQHGANIDKALPLGTVLTIPATGSEMNHGGVVTRREMNAKLPFRSNHVFPVFSVLDPQKTLTLPEQQVANGIVDAFVHIVEQYVTYPAGAQVQDAMAEGLLRILIAEGPKALSHPHNLDIRANLMWTATLALNGLIGAGAVHDWSTHMIGHELTALYNIDHARTLAIVLPGVWAERKAQKTAKLLQFAERVWGLQHGSDDERIDAAIAKTEAFFQSLGVATRLGDYGLDAEAVTQVVAQLQAHGMVALGERQDITPHVSRAILLRRL